jgi:hypothetical protein
MIVLFRGRVIIRQYILKKYKHFDIKIYRLCDIIGYTYDMKAQLRKDTQYTAQQLTATPATVTEPTR